MKIFISWSGDKSHDVATELHKWLPFVINWLEPFVSSNDIKAGSRWQHEVAQQLESTNFGIVCVTSDNQYSPWLNFEAGALAKALDSSRVVPMAIDLRPSDIEAPLGQFQAQPATKTGMRNVVQSINSALRDRRLPDGIIERSYEKWWPDLADELKGVHQRHAQDTGASEQVRSKRELLEEVLDTVRGIARTTATLQESVTHGAGSPHDTAGDLFNLLLRNQSMIGGHQPPE